MKRLIIANKVPMTEGEDPQPDPFFRKVGETGDGRVILDCEDRAEIPRGAEVLSEGPPDQRYARVNLGKYADRVLDAVWKTKDEEGNAVLRRGRIDTARRDISASVESDLPPHKWFGE